MSHAAPGQLEAYNSLQDKHLSGYFNNNRMKKHLVKTGLITKRGKIIDEKTYRLNMAKKEHRKHVRDLLATAILHKALDMERHRQYEIRKRLDDVYKVELVRKVKEERGRKGDEHILPLLTPRERSARRKARKHSRPSTAPAGTLSGSIHPLDIQYDDTTGKPYYTVESGQETAMNTFMKDDDDPNTPYTRAYPGTYPVPAPPPTGTPRRTRPSTSIASRRKTRPHRFHYLAKTEPAIAHRVQLQSMAEVTMKFLGPSLTLTNSMFPEDRLSEVMVVQQHCGGSTLCVFRELLPPNTIFTFISRRHRGSPFGLTFYIDSMQDIRLSSCCEYKHKPGLILGGRNGHFQFVQVEGAAPCYRCQISSGVRSPRDKNQNGQEEDEEENGEKTFITEDEEDNQSFDVIITKVDTNDDEKQDSEEKTNNATQTPRDDQTDESKDDKTEDNKQDSTAEEESRDKDEDEKYDEEDFEDDEDKEKDNDQEDNTDKEEETEAKTDNYKDDFESEHEDPAKESDEEEEEKKKDKDGSDSSSSSSSSDSSDSSDDEDEDKKKRKKKKGKKSQDEDVVDKTEENKEQRKEDDNVDKEEEVIDETETKQDKKEEDVHEEDTQYDVVDETEDIKKQKKDDQESQEEDVIDETETKQDDKNEEGDHEEDIQYDVVDETEDSQKEKKDKQDVEKEEQEEDVVDETEVRKEEKKEEEKESEAEDVADETVEKPKDNEQEQHEDGWDVDDDDTQDKQENNDSDSDSEMKRTNRTVSFDEDVKIINNNDNAVDTPSEIPELSEEDTKQSDGVDKSSESKPETNDTEESPTDDVNALEDKEDQGTKDDVDIKPDDSLEVVSPEPPSDSDSSDSSSSDSSDSEDEKDEPNHDPGNDPDSVASEKLPDQALKVIGVQPGAKHEGSIRPLVEDKKDIELTSLLLEPEQIDELVDIIAKRDSVGSITLRNTGITDDSIEKLVTILKPTSVKMLNLNVNKISPTGAGHIANLIKENKSLRMLLLHGNPINDMGVHDILDAIIHTEGTSISNLDLGDCQMGDAGATDIARLLLNNTTVTDLTISGNSIGLSGWRIISSALEQNTTLKSLSLDFSNIRDDEAVILAEGLKENTGLRSLDLEGNKIGDEGGRSLLDAVKVNSTIVDLTLMPINEISKDIYDEIKTILEGRSRTPSRVSSATGSIRSSLSTKEDKPLDEPAPRNDVQETTSRNDDKETTPNETTSSDATQGESKPSTEDDSEQDTEDTAPKTEVSKPEVSTPEESVAEDDVDTPTVTVENGEVYQLVT